jgi:PAB1-binding protein PBP1
MPLVAALATAGLAVGASAAVAGSTPTAYFSPTTLAALPGTSSGALSVPAVLPAGGCVTSSIEGQGRTGGTASQSCVGAGLSFIGPSSQVSTLIGPTIITAGFAGTSIVAAGNVAIGP